LNQYLPGQGIAAHLDDTRRFGSYVLAVSLGSDITMTFHNSRTAESVEVRVPRRSAYVLTGDARYASSLAPGSASPQHNSTHAYI
jgi:alkylated DNA repair dioxygenase AlkB